MNAAPLPAGYRIRRPAVDDAPAIYRLLAACDIAAIGFPDVTEEDVRDAFAEPDYDPDTDGWLGYADNGDMVGYADNGDMVGYADNGDMVGYADNGDMVGYADNGDMVGYAWALRRGSSGAVDIDF